MSGLSELVINELLRIIKEKSEGKDVDLEKEVNGIYEKAEEEKVIWGVLRNSMKFLLIK